MKQYAVITLALLLLSMPAFAQETATQTTTTTQRKKTFQPDVTGSLLFGVGFNVLDGAPDQLDLRTWGSKSVNLYYLYDINIGASKFSFHPGIGLGLEKYELDGALTLAYAEVPGQTGEVLVLEPLQNVYESGLYKKNRLGANYVDVPLEISWVSNKTNPKGGFKVALGGKVGVLFGSQMKVKYTVGDETFKIKTKRDWGLNPFRYAAVARVAYSSFNLYFEYQLSSVFDAGSGPMYRTSYTPGSLGEYRKFPTDMTNWRVGLAIELF